YQLWQRSAAELSTARNCLIRCGDTAITATRAHWTFIFVACGKNWAAAATASRPWSASVIASSVACMKQRPQQVQRMIESRSIFGHGFLALIALLVIAALMSGSLRALVLVVLDLILASVLGCFWDQCQEALPA